MKKIFFLAVFILAMVTTANAQPKFLAKVTAQDLVNNELLIRYYYDIPRSVMFTDLPESRMIQLMTAVDKQCESAYLLNLIYIKQPTSTILKQALLAGIIQVGSGQLMDFNKALKRYNELKH